MKRTKTRPTKRSPNRGTRPRRGAMLVIIAIALPVFLILAAFAVNVAQMELTRTELRTSNDFAARAGARTLSFTGSTTDALAAAQDAASRNPVGGSPLTVENTDIVFGRADRLPAGDFNFTTPVTDPNAIRVNANLSGTGQAVGLFLGGIVGESEFEPAMSATAAQIDRDIAIVLDRSGSMARNDDTGSDTGWVSGDPAPDNSRWMSSVNGVLNFLTALQSTPMDEQVALVTYADNGKIDYDLTLDYTPIPAAIDVYTQAYVDGYTNIADGIAYGRQCLVDRGHDRSWAAKTIVVLTDGIHNKGDVTPAEAAATAAAQGIIIHTITFGNDANQTDMAEVAAIGHGQHWHAPTKTQLATAFNEIADNSPTMLIE